MHYTYRTKGTCSTMIDFDMEEGTVTNVRFIGGCDGNLKAIPRLVEGWNARDIIDRLKGLTCGRRLTSCADQLAAALMMALDGAI